MPPLNWRHQSLIQSLLSRGPLNEDDFRSIFSQLVGDNSGEQEEQNLLNEYLRRINLELAYVQLELRACRNQYDGRVYYGIVNVVSDQHSRLGTKYKVPQIAFYKAIVEAIIRDAGAEGYISYMSALFICLETQVLRAVDSQSQRGSVRIPWAFKNFSMPQKAKTLHQLQKDQWLCSSPEGQIGLGVRSFLELRSWFRSKEVPACQLCNEPAIKAQLCDNETCSVRLHSYCMKQKFSGEKVEKVCPGCGTRLQIAYDLSPYSQSLETCRKMMKRESYQESNNAHGISPNLQPLRTPRKRTRRGSYQESNNARLLSSSPQPVETPRKRTRRGSNQEASNAYGRSPNSQPVETPRKRTRRGSNQEANNARGRSPNSQPLETARKRTRHGSNREASNAYGLSPNTQPLETPKRRTGRGSNQEASNAYSHSPNNQPLETPRKRTGRGSNRAASDAYSHSPNTQPLKTPRKRTRRGSNQEGNGDTRNASSSPTYAALSGTKMVTRSAARLSTDKKMLKFYSL